jgi:glyoxylase-like metal-dependent hydrolase (beta-lactamase superfamily II)/rhodanese-related sulfurtransferase
MLFRQLFDSESCTYTYLLASRPGGEALIIDPVLDRVDHYMRLLEELDLDLIKVADTHVHADHITAMGALRDKTKCVTVMGEQSSVDVVSMRVREGDNIAIEGLSLEVVYTPGHTNDSYCFRMADRVFTGDTLFIRGTGRTDFQGGSSRAQYDSIFNKLLKLPEETLVYPGHDYKGDTVSTIGEEIRFNPRLQVSSADEYAEIMDNLNLSNPKMMDVAVPANQEMGAGQGLDEHAPWALTTKQVMRQCEGEDCVLVDLRESSEREAHGVIPGSVYAPYGRLDEFVKPGGLLREMAERDGKRLIYYCAYGERSALAVQTSQGMGVKSVYHLVGGVEAWTKAGGALDKQ